MTWVAGLEALEGILMPVVRAEAAKIMIRIQIPDLLFATSRPGYAKAIGTLQKAANPKFLAILERADVFCIEK
jgi:hypothetical protein